MSENKGDENSENRNENGDIDTQNSEKSLYRPISPPERKEILRLYEVEGETIDEISAIYPFFSRSSIARVTKGHTRGSKGVSPFSEPSEPEPSGIDTTKGQYVRIDDVKKFFEPRVGKSFFALFQQAYAKREPSTIQAGGFQIGGMRDRIGRALLESLELKAFLSGLGIDPSALFSNPSSSTKNPSSLDVKELMNYGLLMRMAGKNEDADKYFNLVKEMMDRDIKRLEHQIEHPAKSDIERVIELYTWGEKDPQIRKAIQALLGVEKGPTLGEMIDGVRKLGLDQFLKDLGAWFRRTAQKGPEEVSPPATQVPEPAKMGELPLIDVGQALENVQGLSLSGEEKGRERKPRYSTHEEGEPATGTFEEQERR